MKKNKIYHRSALYGSASGAAIGLWEKTGL